MRWLAGTVILGALALHSCLLPDDFHKNYPVQQPSDGGSGTTVGVGGSGGASGAGPDSDGGEAGGGGEPECSRDEDCLDDSGPCDGVDRCVEGRCDEGVPLVCVAKDACHQSRCDERLGCVEERVGTSDDTTDHDRDGFPACVDCNDDALSIHPTAVEVVGDEIDQDCDGGETCFADADADGVRTGGTVTSSDTDCSDPGEASLGVPDGDADDLQACVRAGQLEFCNGVDDDYDGTIDEACRPMISAGADHSCALRRDGTLECWGDGYRANPTSVTDPMSTMAAGAGFTCAVDQTFRAECWGTEGLGGVATKPLGEFTAISTYEFNACGLTPFRTIECWGENGIMQSSPPPQLFDAVSVGRLHACGLRSDGDIACWGDTSAGAAGDHAGPYVNVSAGGSHTCGVHEDGSIECWGDDALGQSDPPSDAFLTVSAGRYHTCGLKRDQTIACWGDDTDGQSAVPAGSFAAVSAGIVHTCGLRVGGALECWGSDVGGQSSAPSGEFAESGSCGPLTDPQRVGPLFTPDLRLVPACAANCSSNDDYLIDWGVVAGFDFVLPPDSHVVDAEVHGRWGFPSSAPADVFVEGVLVESCAPGTACFEAVDGVSPEWTARFSELGVENLSDLFGDGHADVSVRQLGRTAVVLQDIFLVVFTEPNDPSSE